MYHGNNIILHKQDVCKELYHIAGYFRSKIFVQVPQNQFRWLYFRSQYISKYNVQYTTVSDHDVACRCLN